MYRNGGRLLADDPSGSLPPVMLWAWERPEDLRFLDCAEAGVAYLAGTVTITEDGAEMTPRMQPLLMREGCPAVAVVRIEAPRVSPRPDRAPEIARRMARMIRSAPALAWQVDFDATESQRAFYRSLLDALRMQLPNDVELTITALASWCIHDNWIRDLPIDAAIPMLFEMGVDDAEVRRYLAAGNDFRVEACRSGFGVSTEEQWPAVPPGRRRWVFHNGSWSRAAYENLVREGD